MIRLWFQKHTIEGRVPLLDQLYQSHFAALLHDDIEIHIESLPAKTYSADLPEALVRYGVAESFFVTHFVRQAIRAEQEGYDAYIIGSSQDPGLKEARAAVNIPVVGYGQTAVHFSAMAGMRVGVVGFIPELEEPIRHNLRDQGMTEWCTGFRYIKGGADVVHAAFAGDHAAFLAAFLDASSQLIAMGAQAILPGEGLPNELLVHLGVHDVEGAPVIDPDGLAVLAARFQVELRRANVLGASARGYWQRKLSAHTLDHLVATFLASPCPNANDTLSSRRQ
jgi:allantoin racemase